MDTKIESKKRSENRRIQKLKREQEGKCIYCGINSPKHDTKGCESCSSIKVEKNKLIKNRNEKKRNRDLMIKHNVIDKYGGVCLCCGESEKLFLTIDHVNNDGKIDRDGYFYYRLYKNDLRNDLQVMCFNCNLGRSINNGVCPHKHIFRNLQPMIDGRKTSFFDRNTKIDWPLDDELIKMCNESSIRKTAKKLGINPTTIISRLTRRNKYDLVKNKNSCD